MSEQRDVQFQSLDEVATDIESLDETARVSGNHSLAAIVRHLAITNEIVVGDAVPPKLPLPMRLAMPLMRKSILNSPAKPGFKLPTKAMQAFFWPENDVTLADAKARFKKSVQEYNSRGPLPAHPVFGKATPEQMDNLVLSHAAMHLSFVHST